MVFGGTFLAPFVPTFLRNASVPLAVKMLATPKDTMGATNFSPLAKAHAAGC